MRGLCVCVCGRTSSILHCQELPAAAGRLLTRFIIRAVLSGRNNQPKPFGKGLSLLKYTIMPTVRRSMADRQERREIRMSKSLLFRLRPIEQLPSSIACFGSPVGKVTFLFLQVWKIRFKMRRINHGFIHCSVSHRIKSS